MSRQTRSIRVASQGLSQLFLKTFDAGYSDSIDRPWVSEDDPAAVYSMFLSLRKAKILFERKAHND